MSAPVARRALLLALSGCGFRPARPAEGARLGGVEAEGARGAGAAVIEGAVAGARAWLGAEGWLGEGSSRLVLLRLGEDEVSAGIALRGGEPGARASRVRVRGEGELRAGAGEARWRSGEVTVEAEVARREGVEDELVRREEALRGLGFRLGEAIARRLVGQGPPGEDRMW